MSVTLRESIAAHFPDYRPDPDAAELYRVGCHPTPYAREILSAVRHERARLADEPSEP